MIPGILLAAGTSSRMGRAKQLLDWRGEPLVRHVAQQALASTLDGLVVVVGHEAAAVRAALDGLPVRFVENTAYIEGQASSLRTGLAALPSGADATLVLLCDQPLVTPGLVDSIVGAFGEAVGSPELEGRRQKAESSDETVGSRQEDEGRKTKDESRTLHTHRHPVTSSPRHPVTPSPRIPHPASPSDAAIQNPKSKLQNLPVAVIPRYEGQRGNPVLLARALFAELAQLRGDEGARGVLGRYRERVCWLDLDDPAVVTDIDTIEAYEALKRSG